MTDLSRTVRRAWELDYQGQLYYLREADQQPVILVKKGSMWEYVPPEQREWVLEAFRAEWRKGNRDDGPETGR